MFVTNISMPCFLLASYANSSFDLIVIECAQLTDNYVKLLHMLKPSGKLHLFSYIGPAASLLQEIKLSGFINCSEDAAANTLTAEKPGYETGSSARLSFAKKSSNMNVWKISGDDEELIDEEDLLDELDKQKPDPAGLRVCSTTGKRKACKNCSCGLAEELESEKSSKAAAAASENAKSSCGNVSIMFMSLSSPHMLRLIFHVYSATWVTPSGALPARIWACLPSSPARKYNWLITC